jgi:uncharacterized membrane protein YdjX (TVP38/TMEM64 family)
VTRGRILLLLLLAVAIAAFFLLDLGQYLTLDSLKARQAQLASLVEQRPLLTIGGFFLVYVAVTALSLPGAAIMTLAAGAIFGLLLGTVIVSFASAIGASLAFLSSRYVLRDWVQGRFGKRVSAIDKGIEKDGAFYLLTLRLIPAFPFFLINLAMGLTRMRLPVFYIVSQIGMLAGTVVFVNAGTQLAQIRSTSDILTPALIGSFVLLGLFPLVAKFVLGAIKRKRVYKGYKRPKRFDRNLIVIGAGAGGLVTSYIAAMVKAKVTLIEAHKMGGDCLNTGCVPSKALIRTARLAHEIRTGGHYGLTPQEPAFSFRDLVERIHAVIAQIEPADSVERYTDLGVDVRLGYARIVDPWTVEIDGKERLTARSIVIAAGWRARRPGTAGSCRGRLSHKRHDVGRAARARRDAATHRNHGRRPDRQRDGAGIRPARRRGHPGGAWRTAALEGRRRGLRAGRGAASERRSEAPHPAQGGSVRRQNVGRRRPGWRILHPVRRNYRRGRPQGAPHRLRAGGARHRDRPHDHHQRLSRDALPQHLRGRRRRRAVSVHPLRRAPGLVRCGQRAVRHVPEVSNRLLGIALGHLYRSRSRACRTQRA